MKGNKPKLLGAMAVLLVGAGLLQRTSIYPSWKKNFAPRQQGLSSDLAPDQLLVAMAGFREMIAGILWVRADSFFDTGNYDAILPIIRLVTWLDPKQIDVYATGMWHIAYNFTDEEQRSDRRYVPPALALGKEGAENNPHTYEMFFETGWLWYHKIDDDYGKAVNWFQDALERKDMDLIAARKNLLSNALQRDGKVQEALDFYFKLLADAENAYEKDPSFANQQNRDTIENNIDTMLVRMSQRGYFATQGGYRDQGEYDIDPPFDVGFSAQVTVEDPMVLRIRGSWNVQPVGSRIRFILRDSDFPNAVPGGLVWDQTDDVSLDPPKNITYVQDGLFVRNRRFDRKIDMSRDKTMYPCTKPEYVIEFYYNPRSAPPHIQDKFSWNGEGMTDKNYLNTDIRPGTRVIFATLKLTRDQLLRRGEWIDRVPVVQTPNYVPPKRLKDEPRMIAVPSTRSETAGGPNEPAPGLAPSR